MKKQIMVDPVVHHDENTDVKPVAGASMSEELQKAIQNLIYRMRELGPIQTA